MNIKHILIDVDGCLTNGKVSYNEAGERSKEFHSRDIPAIKKLKEMGFTVILLSQSTWEGVKYFAGRCGVEWFSGVKNKLAFVKDNGITDYIAIADDISDIPFLKAAELALIPNDSPVRGIGLRLDTKGGGGVVCEVAGCLSVTYSGNGEPEIMYNFEGYWGNYGSAHNPYKDNLKTDNKDSEYDTLFGDRKLSRDSYMSILEMMVKQRESALSDPCQNFPKGDFSTNAPTEPDPHDFCANAATAKTCKGTAEQLAQRAKQEVHALKNLAVLEGDETADKKAGRIYDLIDQIVVCGISEKRYGNSCILDHNAKHKVSSALEKLHFQISDKLNL